MKGQDFINVFKSKVKVCVHVSNVKVVHKKHEDLFFLGAIIAKDFSDSLFVTLRIQEFKIYSGADISIISEQIYEALNMKPRLMLANAVLDCPGGKRKNV